MQRAAVIWLKTSASTGVGGETIQNQKADLRNISKDSRAKVRSMITTEMQRLAKDSSAHETYGIDLL